MTEIRERRRKRAIRTLQPGVIRCPACGGPVKPDAARCSSCAFTGEDSMRMFTDTPPPLLPVLDAAGIFSKEGVSRIEATRKMVRTNFPQFHWAVCAVNLPPGTELSVFGFWLMNVCPLHENETTAARAWTVLLLMDAASGKAAVVPGYGAEPFLSDDDWKNAMAPMTGPWRAGDPAAAVTTFLTASHARLKKAWGRYGSRG